jgi:hypothetical protein
MNVAAEQSIPPASAPIPRPVRDYSWWHAALLTASAIYGPQLLMCLYTLGFVACSHCKTGVWLLAPIAPGLLLYEWGRHIFGLEHSSSAVGLTCTIALSLLVFGGLTVLMHNAERWRVAILIAVTLASGFIAVALLGAMRA